MDPPAVSDDMQAQIERLEAMLRSQQTEMERFRQEASDSRATLAAMRAAPPSPDSS